MKITIYQDTVCPFCRIGKRHLQQALENWQEEPVSLEYCSFFLDPHIPAEGYEFVPYMQAKFRGRMSIQQAFDAPRRMGEPAGLVFNMEKITRAPNTLLSHALILLAPAASQAALIDDIYAAYFEHGQDIGSLETLIQIGVQHGLDEAALRRDLPGDDVKQKIEAQISQAQALGIHAVPFFIVNDRYAFSGAQPPEVITRVLHQVLEKEKAQ